ncbi:unnamed protein product, partial [Effrenium voratum]
EYMEATKLLEKASYTAHKVMTEDALQSHDGNEDALRADPSLGLLRSRQELVRLARNSATGDEGKVASAALYAAAIEDPYLRDLRQSFLTESICQTIGSVQESRDCKLEMQPTVAAVTELAEKHTNAVISLSATAGSPISLRWQRLLSNARKEEAKAMERLEKKEKALAAKEEARAAAKAAKAAKLAEDKARAEAAALQDQEAPEGNRKDDGKTRHRRTGGHGEIDADDPTIIQCINKLPPANVTPVYTDLTTFLIDVAADPTTPCLARLKKGALKKGPATLLALDALTQLELERRTHSETVPEAPFDIKASVMDRG